MGTDNSSSLRAGDYCSAKRIAAIVLITLFMFGCAARQVDQAANEAEYRKTTLPFGEIKYPFNMFSEYRIAPGDVLDVLFQFQIWEKTNEFRLGVDQVITVKFESNPELNEIQRIRPDGTISLPYLKTIQAARKTVGALTEELITAYTPILREPGLYITVSEFQSAIRELKDSLLTTSRGASRLTTVRPGGFATFPLIDDIPVAGRTIPEVNTILNDKYRQISNGLQCNLFLEKKTDTLIYIIGEARTPGAYNIQRPVTIIEALALAGGHTHQAKLESVIVIRKQNEMMVAKRINVSGSLKLRDGSGVTYLQPDDIIYIPRSMISKVADVAGYLESLTFFKGWSISKDWRFE